MDCDVIEFLSSSLLANILLLLSLIVTSLVAFFTIRNVNLNTARQIENQNKQNYRPYLNVKIVNVSITPFSEIKSFRLQGNRCFEAYISKGYKKVKAKNIYLLLELENYGNGLMDRIKLFDFDKEFFLFSNEEEKKLEISNESKYNIIKKEGKMQLQLEFKASISPKKIYGLLEKRTTDYSNVIFVYKDINGNTYSTKLLIDLYYEDKPLIKYELSSSEKTDGIIYDLKDKKSNLYSYLESNLEQ